jgi:hypothetical protein
MYKAMVEELMRDGTLSSDMSALLHDMRSSGIGQGSSSPEERCALTVPPCVRLRRGHLPAARPSFVRLQPWHLPAARPSSVRLHCDEHLPPCTSGFGMHPP